MLSARCDRKLHVSRPGVYLDEAFAFWLSQVIHNRHLEEFVKSPIALDSVVHKLDNQGAAELLLAIADRLRQS